MIQDLVIGWVWVVLNVGKVECLLCICLNCVVGFELLTGCRRDGMLDLLALASVCWFGKFEGKRFLG